MVAYTFIHGAAAYLVGAHRLSLGLFYEFTYDRDLAHKFNTEEAAAKAQELLNDGRHYGGQVFWCSTGHHIR